MTSSGSAPASALETAPLRGRTALVLGLGRFSGGVESVRFLAAEGARVVVSDTADPATLAASVAAIEGTGARAVFGPQTPELLAGLGPRDLVVASPAIPFDHPVLAEAERRGIPTTTEINLFVARVRAPILGVTGTKGKSTTSTLLANMLAATGRTTHLGGNVGRSLLGQLARIAPDHVVVLELSSFQLHWLRRAAFRPSVAVVTNLFPDHLDRHGTFEAYARDKRALLDAQRADDVAVLPVVDAALDAQGFRTAGSARRVGFGEGPFEGPGVTVRPDGSLADVRTGLGTALPGFALWGRHNRGNAAAAAAAALAFGASWDAVREGAVGTRPLSHRLEPVHTEADLWFVDDSIATTPQSAAAALEAVPRPCVVLVGGKDKGLDPAPLLAAIQARARGVVGIGTTGPALVAEVLRRGGVPAVLGGPGPDLTQSVRAACALARPGDAILLSPGYASLDQYASFTARGDEFARAARAR